MARARLKPAAVGLLLAAALGTGICAWLRETRPADVLEIRGRTMGTTYEVKVARASLLEVRSANRRCLASTPNSE